jgi:Na+/proline symporter
MEEVRGEFLLAHRERSAAARAFASARETGGDVAAAREEYLEGERRVERAEARARRLAEAVTGEPYDDTNYVFPTYIVSQLAGGLAGLVIAVIFAAAMSSLSGEFNSLATTTLVDFYRRFAKREASDRHYLAVSRLFTAGWGAFACYVALETGRLGSAIVVVNMFGSYFYGSILGVFGLAVLTPRATARGAFYGLLAGMAAVFLVSRFTDIAFLWYNVVGATTVFLVGQLITAVAPGARPAGAR